MTRSPRQILLAMPGIGVAMLPKLLCPMCWPLYAGIVSSVGLGFLVGTEYLLLIAGAFLTLTVAILGFRATQRRGYGPFIVGAAASGAILTGKFYWESNPLTYGGVALLVIASVWNAWPRRTSAAACPRCDPVPGFRSTKSTKENIIMEKKRAVEIFSAGCGCCEETINLVKSIACPSCEITINDMSQPAVAERAKHLGIRSVPAVVIDGKLAGCCTGRGPDEATLRASGLGVPA